MAGPILWGANDTANNLQTNLQSSNYLMPTTTSSVGQFKINAVRVLHSFGGSTNVFVGATAGALSGTATNSTGIGSLALTNHTSQGYNTAVGYEALTTTTDGLENTAVGYDAMKNGLHPSKNTAVGALALYSTSTASFAIDGLNVGIGRAAGFTNTSGVKNTLIGAAADVASTGLTNAIAIGYNAVVSSSNTMMLGGTGSELVNIISGAATTTQKFHIRQDTATYHYYGEAQSNTVNVAMAMRRSRASNANLATNDVIGDFDFIARSNSADAIVATIEGMYTGSGTTQVGDILFKTANSGSPATRFRIRQTDCLFSVNKAQANDTTNTSFVNSGETAESAAASATSLQSASATFSTDTIMFTVTVGTDRQSILCHADYATATITAVSDPSNIFLASDSGTGIYISKSATSAVVTVKNRTGNTRAILIQAFNSNLSSVSAWA